MNPVLTLAIGAVALLYASVGHAGATGYIAVMTLFGLDPQVIRPTGGEGQLHGSDSGNLSSFGLTPDYRV